MPVGCHVVSVSPHGKGSWSSGYKVDIDVDDEEIEYFVKVISRPNHFEMARGEFESQKELEKYLPDNVASPSAYGTLELDSSSSFFLTPFRHLSEKVLDSQPLAEVLDKLHRTSASPTGKFGFHVATFNGVVPLVNDWCDTWEEYYGRQLRADIQWMHSVRGPDPKFDETAERFFEKVIPRLLRPLQSGGRTIKPSLVHGDVWPGNIQLDTTTRRAILYDSCCCYGHNELDLAMMREPRYQFTKEHADKYKELVPPSAPVEDFDDRNSIYAMCDNIINVGLHDHRQFLREQVMGEMERLINKYPGGIDGYELSENQRQPSVNQV
ncbi:Fructosamine kinase-domain-containing protein [Xylaria bambusicola]|uniref:Fructosamine kinase-domain-containing protein n=1 Tax=Xylaria bambusicola TaxID=326684 RepID=UPI0020080A28|nr:Fructosamine kinase-domain-containing protein [Xylaria bambusicola]KAI0508459.1 Fructosamine kinase-domain-containing protein [Xylaria bambusicola]